jgi:hypothetical protein
LSCIDEILLEERSGEMHPYRRLTPYLEHMCAHFFTGVRHGRNRGIRNRFEVTLRV